jgi:hypothetical protein
VPAVFAERRADFFLPAQSDHHRNASSTVCFLVARPQTRCASTKSVSSISTGSDAPDPSLFTAMRPDKSRCAMIVCCQLA